MSSSGEEVKEDSNVFDAIDGDSPPLLLHELTATSTNLVQNKDDNELLAMEEWLRQQEEEEHNIGWHDTKDATGHQEVTTAPRIVDTVQVDNVDDIDAQVPPQQPVVVDDDVLAHVPPEELAEQQRVMMQLQLMNMQQQQQQSKVRRHWILTYRPLSFLTCLCLLWYALRTRKQYYFAAVFLSHSKMAYVIFGNTVIATAIVIFDCLVYLFFRTSNVNGLRIQEAEGLQDFFRWNVTETCFAFTMFRYELNIITAVQFVFLILLKCLHYVASQREQHLRMTEDAIISNSSMGTSSTALTGTHPWARTSLSSYFSSVLFIRSSHVSIITFYIILQMIDMYIIQQSILHIFANGPSVKILFAFEAAILLVSTYSHIILYFLHFVDCIIQYGHDIKEWYVASKLLHPWKEYKATLIFAIELQAQAINFLFYCTFFCIVLTFYGLPINLFREVYMSFMKFKERLTSFFHYRQLMASMNRFRTATEEELNENGRTCIICRDEMTSGHDCKKLPVCGHTFHKSCLREWLVQQQTCPTCRADIAAMEALEASRTATANAAAQRAMADPGNNNDTNADTTTGNGAEIQEEVSLITTNISDIQTNTNDVIPRKASHDTNKNDGMHQLHSSLQRTAVRTAAKVDAIFVNNMEDKVVRNTTTSSRDKIPVGDRFNMHTIPPTLYVVIGDGVRDNVPIYSFTTDIVNDESISKYQTRTVSKNTLVVGVATWFNYDSEISFIQLPDHTWIIEDHVHSLYILKK